jgi:hypothetical protein
MAALVGGLRAAVLGDLILLRISGQTAYVCPAARYEQAVDNPDVAVGFPLEDVTFEKAA